MVRLYSKLILLLSILFSSGCTANHKIVLGEEDIIKIDVSKDEKYLNMSEIVDSIQYLRLSTNSDHLIGNVSKLIPFDDKIMVVDNIYAQSIFLFTDEGEYISQIGSHGAGPEEYVFIESVTVDTQGKRIFIYDSKQRKILTYTFQNEFIESFSPDFFLREIEYVGNNVLACYCGFYSGDDTLSENNEVPLVVLYDLNNENKLGFCFESAAIASTETILPYQTLARYSKTGATFYYPLGEYIYDVDKHNVKGVFKVIFSEENEKMKMAYMQRLRDEVITPEQLMPGGNARGQFYQLTGVMRGDNFIFIGYQNRESAVNGVGLYYLKNRRFISGQSDKKYPIKNDIDNCYPLIPDAITGDKIYTVIDAGYLEELDTSSIVLKELQQTLTSDDNPVIMISNMKIENR